MFSEWVAVAAVCSDKACVSQHWPIYTCNRPPIFLCYFTSIKDQKIEGLRVKIAGKWKKAVASVNTPVRAPMPKGDLDRDK